MNNSWEELYAYAEDIILEKGFIAAERAAVPGKEHGEMIQLSTFFSRGESKLLLFAGMDFINMSISRIDDDSIGGTNVRIPVWSADREMIRRAVSGIIGDQGEDHGE